jgi:hypothetical protein
VIVANPTAAVNATGHLAARADDDERDLLDAFDLARSGSDGRRVGAGSETTESESG